MFSPQEQRIIFLGVLVALLVFLFIIVFRLSSRPDLARRKMHYSKAVKVLKSGDLLAVSYNAKSGRLVKFFTGSVWTHCGLVVEDKSATESNGEKCLRVIEVADYRQEGLRGVVAKPLEEWFAHNRDRMVAMRPYLGRNFPTEPILQRMTHDRERGVQPDFNHFRWLKTLVKRQHCDPEYRSRDKYYCSEYVTHLLQEHGILRRDYYPDGYKPWELLYGDLPLLEQHYYGDAITIVPPDE